MSETVTSIRLKIETEEEYKEGLALLEESKQHEDYMPKKVKLLVEYTRALVEEWELSHPPAKEPERFYYGQSET
jgi:hypothetical protein